MSRLRRYLVKGRLEAGCDEAGRGCLAGPVFAAAVILRPGMRLPGINDSKKLSEDDRNRLRGLIEQQAIAWAVAQVAPREIDRINILNASFKAMHLAIDQLDPRPEMLLIDGNRFHPYPGIPAACIVQGDGKYAAIAAASILAKTHRDDYMRTLHQEHPEYDWENNVGYPTEAHREGIRLAGKTAHHRVSFRLLPDPQLDLFEHV
ncbi:MAG: ribonuclease HII [Saprospiraceae bacterium]|nr:ribonuclease HII [Saprospiraceae bacterium]